MPILTETERLQLCLERDRLLRSPAFARSPTMSKLLRFLVDYKLLEGDMPLTAYAVAVEGLGRDDNFDTQIDSYPRVQIGRLRRILDSFYMQQNSDARLFIPYHHYDIKVGPNDMADKAKPAGAGPEAAGNQTIGRSHRAETSLLARLPVIGRVSVFAIIATALVLGVSLFFYLQKPDSVGATTIAYPAIIVRPTEGTISPGALTEFEMVQGHLIGALEKFDQIRVFDEDADRSGSSGYSLESFSFNDSINRVQLRLVDDTTREVIWSSSIALLSRGAPEADLDRAVIDIAAPYGKIAHHERAKYRGNLAPGYPCLLQFHQYIRYRNEALLEPVLKCMNASARRFPHDPHLMSMMVIAKNISEQFDLSETIDGRREDFAIRAAKLDNSSASAAFAVAQNAFFAADCNRGRAWGERAVALNPLDSRIMGYLGIYMLACDMPQGEAYSTAALQMDSDSDLAIVAAVAMQRLRRGEAKAARQLSARYLDNPPGAALGLEIAFVLSSAMLGEKAVARQAWGALAERSGFPETAEPEKILGRWIANPDIVRRLAADFRKADLY